MTELLTAAQMRAIEQAAIASGEVTGLELMERAGRGVVEAIFEEWPELQATSHRAVVLCGPGNNGGDGFVVARLLKGRGLTVEVILWGAPALLPPDARLNYERWLETGNVVVWSEEAIETLETEDNVDLYVDAVFGAGLSRSPSGDILSPMLVALYGKERVVAIDVPTGLCASSGKATDENGVVPFVALTVTFHKLKVGHYLADGPDRCGKVVLKEIGLFQMYRVRDSVQLVAPDLNEILKSSGTHKYTHGHALILSGPPGRGGAARLAARGALRIGAGLVTVGCVPEAIPEHAAQLTAIMLRPLADGAALTEVLADPRITALCLGPGLGLDDRARSLVASALAVPDSIRDLDTDAGGPGAGAGAAVSEQCATVLDADALTLLARDPALFAALHDRCILTPHGGEFSRLFPDIAERLNTPAITGPAYSKVDATREAAKRAGCVVLFKGPDTVIADPAGRCSINSAHYDRAAPWLATAGSGDVLSGFITGLLARGFAPMQAAETAAWLHVECARHFGPGLIAEDLAEQLPGVFLALGV